MTEFAHILIASHGTPGAQAAERAAFALCRARGRLSHLIVVPDLWRGMMGDDWLNNASTRDDYGKYVENQLQREIQSHIDRMRPQALARDIAYEFRVVLGKPTECLLAFSREAAPDLVLIGAPRPKGVSGLRSRMHPEQLAGTLAVPLLVIPYPR
ncbi:MAG: universal stress protein [Betaproteobacteria bacterium]|nr:universal stress protein [Betaproteobacteria bacterium]